MTHTEALEKVAKLLRLAQSANQHEAALAASHAQEIMDRFKLSRDAIKTDDAQPAEEVKQFSDPLDTDGSARWKLQLGYWIAKLNQCKTLISSGVVILIGRASDANTVRYIYGWIVREIDRLAKLECNGEGRTYFNNYRLGAVESVSRRLREQKTQTIDAMRKEATATDEVAGNSGTLMVLSKALSRIEKEERDVEDFTAAKYPKLRAKAAARVNYNSDARARGRAAGNSIGLGGSRGSLAGGSLRIE